MSYLYLHALRNALSIRQDLSQVLSTQNVSEGGLSQQSSGKVSISHVGNRGNGVTDPEVHHAIYANSN